MCIFSGTWGQNISSSSIWLRPLGLFLPPRNHLPISFVVFLYIFFLQVCHLKFFWVVCCHPFCLIKYFKKNFLNLNQKLNPWVLALKTRSQTIMPSRFKYQNSLNLSLEVLMSEYTSSRLCYLIPTIISYCSLFTYLLYGTTALEEVWLPLMRVSLSNSILVTLIFY